MRIFLQLLLLLSGTAALAQPMTETRYLDRYAHPQKSPFSVHAKAGLTALQTQSCSLTDVVDQNFFLKPNLTIGLGYQITNHIGLLLRGSYYRHSCKSDGGIEDFAGVKGDNFEGVLAVKHYLFPLKDFDEYLRRFNYYAIAGAGLLYLNPRDATTGEQISDSHNFNQLTWVVPVGLGVEFRLTNFIRLFTEANYHLTGTSYLDGIPQSSANSSGSKDHFMSVGVGASFRIPHNEYKYEEFLKLKNKPQ